VFAGLWPFEPVLVAASKVTSSLAADPSSDHARRVKTIILEDEFVFLLRLIRCTTVTVFSFAALHKISTDGSFLSSGGQLAHQLAQRLAGIVNAACSCRCSCGVRLEKRMSFSRSAS